MHGNRSKLLRTHNTTGVTWIHFGINWMDLLVLFCYSLTYNQSLRVFSLFVCALPLTCNMHGTLFYYYVVVDNIVQFFIFFFLHYSAKWKWSALKLLWIFTENFVFWPVGCLWFHRPQDCRTRIHKNWKSHNFIFNILLLTLIFVNIFEWMNEWMNEFNVLGIWAAQQWIIIRITIAIYRRETKWFFYFPLHFSILSN